MNRTAYRAQIEAAAAAHGLSADLLELQVLVESGGDPFAWNPEPAYHYLWNVRTQRPFRALTAAEAVSERPPADFPCLAGDPDQEWWGQQASWGLLQVMGAVAREQGCRLGFLPQLCQPATNLEIGASHLAALMRWANGDVAQALAAYNAGRGNWTGPAGQQYARKVLQAKAVGL